MGEIVQTEGEQVKRKRSPQVPKTLIPLIKESYLNGNGSIREVALQYGVSQRALEIRCSREKWLLDKSQVVEKVVKSVEKREDLRLEMLRKHEDRMILRMEKRLETVDKSYEQASDLVEPQELRALVSTESVIDQVMRRNLGAGERVQVTGSVEINVVGILERIRANQKPGMVIDVESEERELSGCELVD